MRLHGLLLGLCASAALAETALDRIRDRGTLEVAVYNDFPPFSTRIDGQARGIDVELAGELARRLGVTASIRLQTADESVEDDLRNAIWKGHYIGGGVADVMLHVPADPRFVNSVDEVVIGGVYYTEDIALAYRRDRFPQAPALSAFESAKVGVEIETIADLYLLGAQNGRLRNQVVHFPKLAAASEALKAGEVSAVMGQRAELQGFLHGDPRFALAAVRMGGRMISSWPLGVAVKAGDPAFSDQVMSTLEQMVEDGTVGKIFNRYGASRGPLE